MCSTFGIRGENGVERRHEFIGHGAAQAAVGKLDDVLLGARGIAAAFEDFAVDADVAELVDDHREPAPVRVGEHMADQRRLPGAEKAGDDRAWDARKRSRSFTLLRKIERRDAGDQPALERLGPAAPGHQAIGRTGQKLRALHQRLRIGGGIEMAEHIGPGRRIDASVRRSTALQPRLQLARQRSGWTAMPEFSAARMVAAASAAPGRG